MVRFTHVPKTRVLGENCQANPPLINTVAGT